jgi:cytochrome c oxidase subunit 2
MFLITYLKFYLIICFLFFKTYDFAFSDAAVPWQLGFQDPATPVMEGIINFHNDLCYYLVIVGTLVGWLLARCIYIYDESRSKTASMFVHSTIIEIVWTVVPALILTLIAVPSFALLYSMDEVIDPAMTLKVIGHQWYWSYEYSDFNSLEGGETLNYDSYMVPEEDLQAGHLRLLEVDNRVVLPVNTHIRVLVTAADVLHCWAMPSFGLKIDACPGRLNQTATFIKREGVYYGQCSEICGVNHGFMPIVIEAVSSEKYIDWISSKLDIVLPHKQILASSEARIGEADADTPDKHKQVGGLTWTDIALSFGLGVGIAYGVGSYLVAYHGWVWVGFF